MTVQWTDFTKITDDQFMQDLDLSESSKERIFEILQKVAEKAYAQGVEDEDEGEDE